MGSYFAQWGIFGRKYLVKQVQTSGSAAKMTFLNYAFGNVYAKNDFYECGIINKAENGGQDGGDGFADYQKSFTAAESVDGKGDVWSEAGKGGLKGNFNQLKKLKAQYPNLKVFISLGGWTWSKWFSKAASTDALRKKLVSSCIDVYIKGNIPYDASSNAGGAGSAAGVFDGIDVDWEYPGVQGIGTNTVSQYDKENNTLLLKEFREQLDALGQQTNKRYGLTVAIGAGSDKIEKTEPGKYSQYLDWINLMSYDFNGGWDAKGPTDFQSHLYNDPKTGKTGKTGKPGLAAQYNIDSAVKYLIAAGAPASKIVLGIPFYGRGWTGVPNVDNGLYQSATGPAKGTYEPGIEDYKVLKTALGNVFFHDVTKQSWKYDGNTFWSYDTPEVIKEKMEYVKSMGLGGAFSWSLDGDDKDGSLMNEMSKVSH